MSFMRKTFKSFLDRHPILHFLVHRHYCKHVSGEYEPVTLERLMEDKIKLEFKS